MVGWGSFLLLIVVGSRFNIYGHLVLTVFTMCVCYGLGALDGEESARTKAKVDYDRDREWWAERGYTLTRRVEKLEQDKPEQFS